MTRPLRIALIGCGNIAVTMYLPVFLTSTTARRRGLRWRG